MSVPFSKPAPVTVTAVPPVVLPDVGKIPDTLSLAFCSSANPSRANNPQHRPIAKIVTVSLATTPNIAATSASLYPKNVSSTVKQCLCSYEQLELSIAD